MKQELPKVYEPQQVEGRIYEMWEKNDCFNGDPDPKKTPFSIVMPPPQRHRPAPHGTRPGLHASGHPDPL